MKDNEISKIILIFLVLERQCKTKKEKSKFHQVFSFVSPDNLMLIQKIKKVNTISEMIKEYNENVNIIGFICPNCRENEFIYYGSYQRNIVYLEDNKIKEEKLGIKRVMCKKCGKTHAIIPSFLVPYKVHALNTILILLEENEKVPTLVVENRFKISRQLILYWKKQFKLYLNKLFSLYCINSKLDLLNILKEEVNLLIKYFINYREILLTKRSNIFYGCIPT